MWPFSFTASEPYTVTEVRSPTLSSLGQATEWVWEVWGPGTRISCGNIDRALRTRNTLNYRASGILRFPDNTDIEEENHA